MYFGQSFHIDFYGVSSKICDDLTFCYDLLDELVASLQMHKQSPPFIFRSPEDEFPDKAGLSGWVPLIESGISIHTLTVREFVTVDVYTCGDLNCDAVTKFLYEKLKPTKHESHHLMRGKEYYPDK